MTADWKAAWLVVALALSIGCRKSIDPKKTHSGGAASHESGTAPLRLVYPYDKTVFARGLPPPDIMWNGSKPNDKVMVSIRSARERRSEVATVERFAHHAISAESW